jgi:hypothetical protein
MGMTVKASDWLHCPFDSSTLPSEKTVRVRQQGEAVGCVPPTALLFQETLNTGSAKPNSQSAERTTVTS